MRKIIFPVLLGVMVAAQATTVVASASVYSSAGQRHSIISMHQGRNTERRLCSGTTYAALLGNRANVYVCAVPATVPTAGFGPFQILSVNTNHRVWLHQNPNGSGWADCWHGSADYPLHGRDQNPGNIQVVTNTAACP